MRVREKLGVLYCQSGNSKGILIHVLEMNPDVGLSFLCKALLQYLESLCSCTVLVWK